MTTLSPKFGPYGGQYVPETLMPALEQLEAEFVRARDDRAFQSRLGGLLVDYAGRPTPITFAARLSAHLGGAQIYLKREDLAHTGAHKINNALGQALLAQRMGKRRIIAETGAGQHGVASATVAALLGLECVVYMGEVDMARQQPNVFRMRLLGTEVRPVASGSRTLKDAINEAIRDWVTNVESTHYLLGSALGPHPYPTIVREFQKVIGREAHMQMLAKTGRLPDAAVACVGGGSNAIGLFSGFLNDPEVKADRGRSRRRGARRREARGAFCGPGARPARRAPRDADVRAPDARRADRRNAFRFRRPGLCRGRPGTCQPARSWTGGIHRRHRLRSARGVLASVQTGRDHPGAREFACRRGSRPPRAENEEGSNPADLPFGERRQGFGYGK